MIIRTKIQFHLSVYKICILSVLPLTKHFLLFEVHQFSLVLFQVSIHNTSMNRDVKNFHHVSNIVTVPIFRILLDIFQDIFPKYIYYEFVDIFSPPNFYIIFELCFETNLITNYTSRWYVPSKFCSSICKQLISSKQFRNWHQYDNRIFIMCLC